jgi:hypothetical protein
MKEWHCRHCGQEVTTASERPDSLRWTDGHVCEFVRRYTEEEFEERVGTEPELDDMDRVNCALVGQPGHFQCGWCDVCDLPRFMCSHLIMKKGEWE